MKNTETEAIAVEHVQLTQEQAAELQMDSLGEKLRVVIGKLPPDGITLGEILVLVGNDSLMFLTCFLTLVFLIPVSIPGVSTVFGAAILLIGINRLLGRTLWLPKSIANRTVSTDKLRGALERALIWFRRLERVSRPHRLNRLTADGVMGVLNNCALILGALLLMAPFGLIPFSNTFPAVAILFLAIGLLQRDGVCILIGYVANVVTIIYFAILIAGGGVAIREAFRYLWGLLP
ncbi:MAG: exopolysaccharide biosynthesis protein [bacterium]|nr:exopolysaccharide biosynthesis protein [bacterium]